MSSTRTVNITFTLRASHGRGVLQDRARSLEHTASECPLESRRGVFADSTPLRSADTDRNGGTRHAHRHDRRRSARQPQARHQGCPAEQQGDRLSHRMPRGVARVRDLRRQGRVGRIGRRHDEVRARTVRPSERGPRHRPRHAPRGAQEVPGRIAGGHLHPGRRAVHRIRGRAPRPARVRPDRRSRRRQVPRARSLTRRRAGRYPPERRLPPHGHVRQGHRRALRRAHARAMPLRSLRVRRQVDPIAAAV